MPLSSGNSRRTEDEELELEESDEALTPGAHRPFPAVEAPARAPLLLDAAPADLSDFAARPRNAGSLAPPPPVGAAAATGLLLEIVIGSRTRRRTVETSALLGRRDPGTGARPDIDFNPDDAVSRRHARISLGPAGYTLTDLGSTNGTYHNGEWLEPGAETPLEAGDEFELGECSTVRVLQVTLPAPLAGPDPFATLALADRVSPPVPALESPPCDPDELMVHALLREVMVPASEEGGPAGDADRRTAAPALNEAPLAAPWNPFDLPLR